MIYIINGKRERGKTTLAVWMARRFQRRAFIDPRGMIHFPTADRISSAADAPDALDALMQPHPDFPEVIYSPAEDDIQQAFEAWVAALKSAALEYPDHQWAILIDEAYFFDLQIPAFQWLAKCTKRNKVHIFITAHRPQDVPTSIRGIADHWLVFETRQPHELKALQDRSEHLARIAQQLRDHDFAHWNDSTALLRVNRTPSSWKLNLSTGA